jgi:hypothetical protein
MQTSLEARVMFYQMSPTLLSIHQAFFHASPAALKRRLHPTESDALDSFT